MPSFFYLKCGLSQADYVSPSLLEEKSGHSFYLENSQPPDGSLEVTSFQILPGNLTVVLGGNNSLSPVHI